MKIIIETVPHKSQDYKTVGNWGTNEDGSKWITVSSTGNDDYDFLVALHEMIEQKLCDKKGLKDEAVTAFDKRFEAMRTAFPDIVGNEEPGDNVGAPYRAEHAYATAVEMNMSQQLGVDWSEYTNVVNSLE